MLDILTNPVFWTVSLFFMCTIILIILASFGKLKGVHLKFGNNEFSVEDNKKDGNDVMNMTLSIIEEDTNLSEQIFSAKQECLDNQLSFAKSRLSSLKNFVFDNYREEDRKNINKMGLQMFGLMFDRDFGVLVGDIFDAIRKNHLLNRTSEEFEEYKKSLVNNEISELKRKCFGYYEPVDLKIVEKIFDETKSIISDSINKVMDNAKQESMKEKELIKVYRFDSIEKKKEIIHNCYPRMSEDEIEKKLSSTIK